MVRKVTLSVKIQAKVNFEGMGAKPHIGKVAVVKRYETDTETEPFVYRVYMEYVCGDLSMHKYFVDTINNGTSPGYLSVQQGNRLASFCRVVV